MMKNYFPALFLVCCGLLPFSLHANDGVPVWTNIFSRGMSGSDDIAVASAVDANGNVYVVGQTTETSGSGYDFATIKYSESGAVVWTNLFGGVAGGDDQPRSLAVDGRGGVYVAGRAYVGPGINWDFVTIKYSSAGVALWTNYFDGLGHGSDDLKAIAVDSFGSLFVVGTSTGLGTGSDITAIKYSSAGVGLWTNTFDGGISNDEQARGLAVDGSGNVFVAGSSVRLSGKECVTIKYSNSGVALWTNYYHGSSDSIRAAAIGVDGDGGVVVAGSDYETIKYSNAGVPMWTNAFNGSGNGGNQIISLVVDLSGNAYVTGISLGVGTSWDYVTIKYTSSGASLWTNVFNGSGNFNDLARALALDKNGNVYVTGYSYGNNSREDCLTIKYSDSGVALWTNRYSGLGSSFDSGRAIAIGRNEDVFVTGNTYGNVSSSDFVTIRYSGAATNGVPGVFHLKGVFGCSSNVLSIFDNPNTIYVVQFATNLADSSWHPLSTNLSGVNGTCMAIDAATAEFQRYYRALKIQEP